jgi:hypothetical protein
VEREITGELKLHSEAPHHLFCLPNIFRVITGKSWTGQVAIMREVMIAHKSVLIKSRLEYEDNTAVNERRLDDE